jgi:hypothetical protein
MWLKLTILEDKTYGNDGPFDTLEYALINMNKIIYIFEHNGRCTLRYDVDADGNHITVKETLKEIETMLTVGINI